MKRRSARHKCAKIVKNGRKRAKFDYLWVKRHERLRDFWGRRRVSGYSTLKMDCFMRFS